MNQRGAPVPAGQDDWDAHWGDYASTAEDNPAQAFRRAVAFDLLERGGPPTRLFDIGAGQGDLLAEAARRWPAAALAGVELSATGVAEVRRKVPTARIEQRNLLLPMSPTGSSAAWATHAVCSEVLEHVDDPVQLLRHAREYLAPGCIVVVTVPGGPRTAFDKHIGHRRHYDRDSLAMVLKDAGLTDVDVQAAGFPVFNLYKLLVMARGAKVIDDVRSGATTTATRAAMRMFDILFRVARRRGHFGWQMVATAKVP